MFVMVVSIQRRMPRAILHICHTSCSANDSLSPVNWMCDLDASRLVSSSLAALSTMPMHRSRSASNTCVCCLSSAGLVLCVHTAHWTRHYHPPLLSVFQYACDTVLVSKHEHAKHSRIVQLVACIFSIICNHSHIQYSGRQWPKRKLHLCF